MSTRYCETPPSTLFTKLIQLAYGMPDQTNPNRRVNTKEFLKTALDMSQYIEQERVRGESKKRATVVNTTIGAI